jgi:hypothetical protein
VVLSRVELTHRSFTMWLSETDMNDYELCVWKIRKKQCRKTCGWHADIRINKPKDVIQSQFALYSSSPVQ